jgi:hypothetical protein
LLSLEVRFPTRVSRPPRAGKPVLGPETERSIRGRELF